MRSSIIFLSILSLSGCITVIKDSPGASGCTPGGANFPCGGFGRYGYYGQANAWWNAEMYRQQQEYIDLARVEALIAQAKLAQERVAHAATAAEREFYEKQWRIAVAAAREAKEEALEAYVALTNENEDLAEALEEALTKNKALEARIVELEARIVELETDLQKYIIIEK